jgi:UDP-N-acetylmuramoyl-L-alanyl-D-glutamate--2,6-diaminopimelate ligase
MKLSECAETFSGPDVEVLGFAYDSRAVKPGFVFAALRGSQNDGHAFITSALERGAAAIVCDVKQDNLPSDVAQVLVPDTRLALAQMARTYYGDPSADLMMVGVTGTNGKTTTTHLLEGILRAANMRPAILGTLGTRFESTRLGGSLTTEESSDLLATLVDLQKRGCNAVAMEVSSHALAQERVAGVEYDAVTFLNLTHDHLDYHGTMQEYFRAKAKLKMRLKPQACAAVNLDDVWTARLCEGRDIGFSVKGHKDAKVLVTACSLGMQQTLLTLQTPLGEVAVNSFLLGAFNVENITAAIACAIALKMDLKTIIAGIESVTGVPGRLERVAPQDPLVLVDYAHTPDALAKALQTVRGFTTGRVLCVFGCGGDRDPDKRALMGEVAALYADWSVVTNDNPRTEDPKSILAAIEEGFTRTHAAKPYVVVPDRAEAIAVAITQARQEDCVLIAGKGHETYQIVGDKKLPFDDRLVAQACLKKVQHVK